MKRFRIAVIFEACENTFGKYSVPNDYKAAVIMLYLAVKARKYSVPNDYKAAMITLYLTVKERKFLGRKPTDRTNDYDSVKKDLLGEFSLTPKRFQAQFDKASPSAEETKVQLVTR